MKYIINYYLEIYLEGKFNLKKLIILTRHALWALLVVLASIMTTTFRHEY